MDKTLKKRCSICRLSKKLSEYTPKKNGKYGLTARCKACLAELSKLNYRNNIEYYTGKNKEFTEKNPEYAKNWAKEHIINGIIRRLKHSAKKRGLPFDLTEEDIVIPSHCPALGIELKFNDGKAFDNSPSVDKIIPSKGYVRGNIVVVSRLANRIKTDATIEQLRKVAAFYTELEEKNN